MNAAPAPVSFSGGTPATLMYIPAAAAPLAVKSLKPSGAIMRAPGTPDFTSEISFAPFSQTRPPK